MPLDQNPTDTWLVLEHIASGNNLVNAPKSGTGVDTRQFEHLVFLIHSTAGSSYSGMTIVLQYSDDNSSWTTDQTIADPGNFNDFKAIYVRTTGFKRYVRLRITPTGGNWSGGVLVVNSGVGSTDAATSAMSWYAEILTPNA